MENKSVLVGMSGGVDSSACCIILKEQGYRVVGATMRLLPFYDESEEQAIKDAKEVCEKIGIEHIVLDYKKEFQKYVVNYFIDEYINGRTPNPCVVCNKYLKFGLMNDKRKELGIDYLATGHYAKIINNDGIFSLKMSDYKNKDQSYFLYNMTQDILRYTLMPLGEYTKDETRKICEDNGLLIAHKKDSQDICFVKNNDYINFIKENSDYNAKEGNILDTNGNIIGKHKGLINYTVGQRKGIGAYGRPMFVLSIDKDKNELILGEKGMEFSKSLIAYNVNFISGKKLTEKMTVESKIRYSAKSAKSTIEPLEDGRVMVIFDEEQRAVTPGQAVVFYNGDEVLGGGTVEKR